MLRFLYATIPILVLILAFGCGDSDDSPTSPENGDTTASFTEVSTLLTASCGRGSSNCHGGSNPQSGFPMTDYDAIVNHQAGIGETVDPGNGDGSNLYLKTTANPPFGSRMPLVGDTLTTDNQLLIKEWIDQGALDN